MSILHIVEVRSAGDDMGASMILMRTWLDHHRLEPDSFCQFNDDLYFRLGFKVESEARGLRRCVRWSGLELMAKLGS